MSTNYLLEALRANDKTGYLFENSSTFIAYKTGFPALDYKMGFNVNVFNKDGKIQETYPSLGITGGSIVTVIAHSHTGKALPIDTPIPTPYGWKRLGHLKPGDTVFNRYGKPVKILGVFDQGKLNTYKVKFSDGREVLCNDEHIWPCYYDSSKFIKKYTVREMIDAGISDGKSHKFAIPITREVMYPKKEFSVHPYVMGAFIGKGSMLERQLSFGAKEIEIVERIANLLGAKSYFQYPNHSHNTYLFELPDDKKIGTKKTFQTKEVFGEFANEVLAVSADKRIPKEYLFGSIEQRYELLRGLLDTDGSIDGNGTISYSTTSRGLIEDIKTLCNSLGLRVSYKDKDIEDEDTKDKDKDIENEDSKDKEVLKKLSDTSRTIYISTFHSHKVHLFYSPLKLAEANKINNKVPKYAPDRLMITDIEDLKYRTPMRCIYVDDPDHCFLCNDYVVTHNTTLCLQIAANMIRPFKNGSIIFHDLEIGSNISRIATVTRFNPYELKDKFVLRQDGNSIEEIKKSIAKIYSEKTSNPDKYLYDTGRVDEFGKPIVAYEPTVIIVDSVPKLSTFINENTKDGQKALEEITTQTDVMRMTGEIGRFLSQSMQLMKTANITMFLINHIKTRPSMGVPQAPELRGMKQDETMPCGKALQYYSNTLIRLTAIGSEKYTLEEHGFNGFGAQALFIKNRSNIDGTIVPLVFDKGRGYDSVLSSIRLAKDYELLGGNKNGHYFINNKDVKFRFDSAREEFAKNRELYKIMYDHIIPVLEHDLASYKPEELIVCDEEMMY